MRRVAVRRINEWDGPSMLKIYAPYLPGPEAPEGELPELSTYIQRIDRYTYGLGWILCEIDSTPAGFCFLKEDRREPENLFSVELQLYVKGEFQGRGVGKALMALITDIMEYGNRKKVTARVALPNPAAEAFFQAVGFSRKVLEPGALKKPGGPYDVQVWEKELSPKDSAAQRPTKPYLIENYDYEMAREQAAKLVREERRSKE